MFHREHFTFTTISVVDHLSKQCSREDSKQHVTARIQKKKKTTRQQRCQPAIEFAETKLKSSAVMTLGEPDTRRVAVVIRCKRRGKSLTVPLVSSPLPLRPSSCSDTVQDGCSLEWANSECLPSWRKIVPAEHESLLAFSCPPTLDPVLL